MGTTTVFMQDFNPHYELFDENLLKAETFAIQNQLSRIGLSVKSFSAKVETVEDDVIALLREELHGIYLATELSEKGQIKKESLIYSINETIDYLKSLGEYECSRIYFQIEFNENINDNIEILDEIAVNVVIPALKMSIVDLLQEGME